MVNFVDAKTEFPVNGDTFPKIGCVQHDCADCQRRMDTMRDLLAASRRAAIDEAIECLIKKFGHRGKRRMDREDYLDALRQLKDTAA